MNVLQVLTNFVSVCSTTPFFLLPEKERMSQLDSLNKAAALLAEKVNTDVLSKTPAAEVVRQLQQTLVDSKIDESKVARVLEELGSILFSTQKGVLPTNFLEFQKLLNVFKYRAFHHSEYTHHREDSCNILDKQKQQEHDQEAVRQKILFYVLEYTLQVAVEMKRITPDQQKQLLETGLQVPAGNLPGLKPLMMSFHDETVYAFCDAQTRDELLKIFLDFEATVKENDMKSILSGLDTLNKNLLSIAMKHGMNEYIGVIYTPYPNGTALKAIVDSLEQK